MAEDRTKLLGWLEAVAGDGAVRAGRGLSGLLGQEVTIHIPEVRIGTREDASDSVGGPDAVVMGAYLTISGDITGHALLLFPHQRALDCVDLMCGQARGTTTESHELALSAVGELGNVVGSAFVNALADRTNLILHPSPPVVLEDLAEALLQTVYAEILAQGGDVIMIDTIFEDHEGFAAGLLLVAPDGDCIERLEAIAA